MRKFRVCVGYEVIRWITVSAKNRNDALDKAYDDAPVKLCPCCTAKLQLDKPLEVKEVFTYDVEKVPE